MTRRQHLIVELVALLVRIQRWHIFLEILMLSLRFSEALAIVSPAVAVQRMCGCV
jgi:hypothetical protein